MVAITAVSPSRFSVDFSGLRLVTHEPPARSISLGSVTSTVSRRSLTKENTKRVRFVRSDKENICNENIFNEDFENVYEEVFEFERAPEECFTSLFYSCDEIMEMRKESRKEACRFTTDYPDYADMVTKMIEGDYGKNLEELRDVMRLRRKRRTPLKPSTDSWRKSMEWLDYELEDDDLYGDDNDENADEVEPVVVTSCDDDEENDDFYCTMRGMELRIAPSMRSQRRIVIRNILELQNEGKHSGVALSIGLRARSVQLTKKARDFAILQAVLDSLEI
jgi:hypothetical protein